MASWLTGGFRHVYGNGGLRKAQALALCMPKRKFEMLWVWGCGDEHDCFEELIGSKVFLVSSAYEKFGCWLRSLVILADILITLILTTR